ncbi:MAG TPA: hypothetical protein DF292_08140 [Firmicutes bacterium]|jgi:uncharacterized membrane protein|nr:hypothetical protein [Bacillota bacterium]
MADISKRFWEIDLIRGVAIVLMVIFHLLFDLCEYHYFPIDYTSGLPAFIGRMAGTLFILTAGISSLFSRSNVKRGLRVFAIGMLLTVATYVLDQGLFIKFGILHFLGLVMILHPLLNKLKTDWLAIMGTIILVVGHFFSQVTIPVGFLFPLGLMELGFCSLDYYPLLPWLGVFMYGMILARVFYQEGQDGRGGIKKRPEAARAYRANLLTYIGRHSLIIYLAHQPILIGLLWVLNQLRTLVTG